MKIFKIIGAMAIFVALTWAAFTVSFLYFTRGLPWQKPVFDINKPIDPGITGFKGVLIFSKTNGYRHSSIEPAIAALEKAGKQKGWSIYSTENGAFFNDDYINRFKVVVFLSTTGDILTPAQKRVFEHWVENGGGYVGIHAAADTEHHWPWYDQLLGTHFRDHPFIPHIPEAEVITDDPSNITNRHLPARWMKTDEWYNFKENVRGKNGIHVLLSLNEASYRSFWPLQRMKGDHPVSWLNRVEKGRMFYTAMGHNTETFSDPNAMPHILAGIEWAGGF